MSVLWDNDNKSERQQPGRNATELIQRAREALSYPNVKGRLNARLKQPLFLGGREEQASFAACVALLRRFCFMLRTPAGTVHPNSWWPA